ncbi:MAG: hypothetical protein HRT35_26965 [Algicola sp.]|nr:hypothetical protein [Algicola sp.]
MQIQSSSQTLGQNLNITSDHRPPPPKPEAGERPPGPPPGLGRAIDTLSDDQRQNVQQMLESLSDEQKGQLKQALDDFKSEADTMDIEDIGQSFLDILSSVANPQKNSATPDNQVDVYV